MKVLKTIIFIMFLNTCIHAQNSSDSTYSKKVDKLYKKAFLFYGKNQDSLDFYLEKVKKIAKEQNDLESYINSICYSNRSATHFYNLEKIRANLKLLDSVISNHKTQLNKTKNPFKLKNDIDFDKGIYNYRINDFEKSKGAFQSIINSIESLPDSLVDENKINFLTTSYNYYAKINSIDNKLDLAKNYYKKNIRYLEKHQATNKKKINRTYSLLAEVLKNQKQYTLSNQYFTKSLQFNLKTNGAASIIVTEANHLLENYLNTSQIDSSKYYLKIIKDNLPENHPKRNIYHEAKAKIHQTENNYTATEIELQKALELIKQKWKNQPHNDIAEAFNNIGLLHAKFNNPDKALENYNFALQQFSNNTNQSTINQSTLLKTLKQKAQALNKTSNYSESLTTINHAIKVLDQLKPTFKDNTDKLFLIEDAFPVFEAGLEASYNLYQASKDETYIDQAFTISERSKSTLLFEALLSAKATEFANIPKELTEEESQLKSKIAHLEKRINRKSSNALQDELFEIKRDYENLISSIETNYKNYYNLKYNTQVATISELQDLLNTDEMLISYFYGNNSIYSIAVTKETKQFFKQDVDSDLENLITEIYKLQSNPKSDLQSLKTKTHSLYQNIIEPVLSNASIKRLIILSDGLLNYIPFEILSTNQNNYNYLIEDYAISYANSATLKLQLKERQTGNSKLLAFAPDFKPNKESGNQLLPLPHNKKEVEKISTYFSGKPLIDKDATLDNFMLEAPNYSIFHLATHAIVDDENPEFSYLAFTKSTDNNLLYVKDIYNLNLSADLVTLSACETGIGDLKRGEGFISLARSFFYCGATSIASTLWKINDASSTQLMSGFYENLSNGNSKDLAMQKTKLAFLKNNNENGFAHPYYWSGFIISGNTDAIQNTNWLWYLFGTFGIILLASRYRKRKKR